ncbi:unnamed protein product [Ceutorhynchus assimilis]|uniref:Uncharacterized protein n=1 Tax=Ceutorhynchus assimilis TaxID=467358 RepID=A0A9N9MS39_9CUCU|nr:unnamed protein product [Ceutorhynchus assimilis]
MMSVKLAVIFFALVAYAYAEPEPEPGYLSYQQPIITKQVIPVVTKQIVPVVQYKQVYSSYGGGYGGYKGYGK